MPRRLPFGSAPARQRRRSLSGSAQKVTGATANQARRDTNRAWQKQALEFCDRIPEANYATTFYGGGMSKLKLGVQRRDPATGAWAWVEDTADKSVQLWEKVQDPGGGRSSLCRSYGENQFAAGEGYLLSSFTEDDGSFFEFVSVEELTPQEASQGRMQYERQPSVGGGAKVMLTEPSDGADPTVPTEAVAWRMWTPSRRRSGDAHAPMRGVLDVCQELLDLTLAGRSATISRLARAGILFLPEELSDPLDPATSNQTARPSDDPEADPLIKDMIEHWMHPLNHDGSPNAAIPYVIRGADKDIKDAIMHLRLYDPDETYPEIALREEAVKRFSRGIQLPVEIIMGMGDANHWSGWLVDDQTWLAHLQPKALEMVQDFTRTYLWPGLRQMGQRPDVYMGDRVWYDEVDLVVNPDRSKDAGEAHAHKAISDKAYRRVLKFNEEDMPTEEDPNSFPAKTGEQLDEEPTGDTSATTSATPPAEGETEGSQQASAAADVIDASLQARAWLESAEMMAIERCRELAGSRLRGQLERSLPEVAGEHRQTPNGDLAQAVGSSALAALGGRLSASGLVAGGTSTLDRVLSAHGWSEDARLRLCAQAEAIAARTLFEESPCGPGEPAAS